MESSCGQLDSVDKRVQSWRFKWWMLQKPRDKRFLFLLLFFHLHKRAMILGGKGPNLMWGLETDYPHHRSYQHVKKFRFISFWHENESPWPLTLALGKRSPCKMLDLCQYWVHLEDQEARLPTGYDKWSKNRQRVFHQQNENPKFAVATWQFGNVSRYLAFYGSDNKSFPDSNTSDLVDRK